MGFPNFQSIMLFYSQAGWILSWYVWVQISSCFKVICSAPSLLHNKDTVFSEILIKVLTVHVSFTKSNLLGILWKWLWDWGLWARQRDVWAVNALEVWSEKEVKLLNTVRLCDIKLVSIHTEELRSTRKAEEPHYSNQRHESLPWPLAVLSKESVSPMGQGWHPHYGARGTALWVTSLTKCVCCPGSWDTLWNAGEERPGIELDLLCGYREGNKGMEIDRPRWSEEHGKT